MYLEHCNFSGPTYTYQGDDIPALPCLPPFLPACTHPRQERASKIQPSGVGHIPALPRVHPSPPPQQGPAAAPPGPAPHNHTTTHPRERDREGEREKERERGRECVIQYTTAVRKRRQHQTKVGPSPTPPTSPSLPLLLLLLLLFLLLLISSSLAELGKRAGSHHHSSHLAASPISPSSPRQLFAHPCA